jgi:hypothetical protein
MQISTSSTPQGAVGGPRSKWVRKVIDHMVERTRAAQVCNDPYQHFFLTDAFPSDVYDEILERLPPRESYLPLNLKRWKNAAGLSTRDRIRLSAGELDRIPDGDQAFWSDLVEALTAREFQQAVFALMLDDVAIRLGCSPQDVLEKPAWPSVLLVRDFEDYQLKPHPDGHPRVVTMMFYLARKGDPEDLGTSVYRRKPLLNRLVGDGFEEVKRFPFLPNSVATFAVNDHPERRSWHGRELISGPTIVRDSIILAWLYKEHAEFGRNRE